MVREFGGLLRAEQVIADILAKLVEKFGHFLLLELDDFAFDFGFLFEVILIVWRILLERSEQWFLAGFFAAGKNTMKCVVVFGRDGIKFMIVAASAGNGEAEQSA